MLDIQSHIDRRLKNIVVALDQDLILKDVYSESGLSEQTFYGWKKKNLQVYSMLISGYRFEKIKTQLEEIASLCKTQEIIKKQKQEM